MIYAYAASVVGSVLVVMSIVARDWSGAALGLLIGAVGAVSIVVNKRYDQ